MNLPQRPQRRLGSRLTVWLERHLQSALATLGTLLRRPMSTLLTAGAIAVALLVPVSTYLVVDSGRALTHDWRGGNQMSAFLRVDVDDVAAMALLEALRGRGDVADARLITREQALEEFRAALGMTGLAASLGDENPLPPVVVLTPSAREPALLRGLAKAVEARPEVELVQLDEVWLDRLNAMLVIGERVLGFATLVLSLGVVLIVGNTLRLTVEARRDEIEVEKLCGASDAFIRRPFLYHGAFYGLAGAVIAALVLAAGLMLLHGPVQRLAMLYGGELSLGAPSAGQWVLLFLIGPVLGLAGAWLSVGRQLRHIEPR
jgi:cell division transport system permease protein